MNTPIADFVRSYASSDTLRLHMPGHKGNGFLGVEALDITEIRGADSLYEADGIIAQSERNASLLFGCPTYYSTEGSSQCIRAMLHLASQMARQQGRAPLVAAARNVHKTFLSAVALLDLEVTWLYPGQQDSYLSCQLTAAELEAQLTAMDHPPAAVYVTSPDYLGNLCDVRSLAQVCHDHGTLLLVDNAHGAYLRFLPDSLHPMDLGADLCCDSAHKTLPVLTGGAYLHTSRAFSPWQVKNALGLFGSTSPSYLVLQSLDLANGYLEDHDHRLAEFLPLVHKLKETLWAYGYRLTGQEPMKITIAAKEFGYTGNQLGDFLRQAGIECEFSDPDYLVMMVSPETTQNGLEILKNTLCRIAKKPAITDAPPAFCPGTPCQSIRDAMLSPGAVVSIEESEGRILGAASVGCPPAVPIVVCGERIDQHAIECFRYYGISTVTVTVP